MRARRAVVGVDLGTSGVKVLVVSLDAAVPDADRAAPDAPLAALDGGVLGRVLGRGRAHPRQRRPVGGP